MWSPVSWAAHVRGPSPDERSRSARLDMERGTSPSGRVVLEPCNVVCDAGSHVEGRLEAGVARQAGGVEVWIVCRRVGTAAGGQRRLGAGDGGVDGGDELVVGDRLPRGDVVGVVLERVGVHEQRDRPTAVFDVAAVAAVV